MTDVTKPPDNMIKLAVEVAMRSTCEKSKRGVVIFYHARPVRFEHATDGLQLPRVIKGEMSGSFVSDGCNGLPRGYACDGSNACRESCAKRCLHAEDRAIRSALASQSEDDLSALKLEAVHVKAVGGKLVAGGGPSCWQCSRTVLDVGLAGFWLFERTQPGPCPYTDLGGAENACPYCEAIWCAVHPELAEATCSCTPTDRHAGLPPVEAHWVRYTAEEFHRITLQACGLPSDSAR